MGDLNNREIILLNDSEMKEVKGGVNSNSIFTCTVNSLKSVSYATAKPSGNSLGKISASVFYEEINHSGIGG